MPTRSIYVIANGRISFLFMTELHIPQFFIQSLIIGHLACFHNLAIVNNPATWGFIYVFELVYLFSLDKYPKCIARWYSNSIFNFLRKLHTVFHSGYTNLHFLNSAQGSLFPHPCQHLLYLVFLIIDMLTGIRWYLIMDLICISLMPSDVVMLGIISGTCRPSVCLLCKKVYSDLLPVFKQIVYLLLSCMNSLCILDISPLSDI